MSHTGILDRNLTIAQAFDAEGGIYFRQRRPTRARPGRCPGSASRWASRSSICR